MKQLEYLESTGTQYIDTEIKFDITGCRIELDMELIAVEGSWFCGTNMDFEGGIYEGHLHTSSGFSYTFEILDGKSTRGIATGINRKNNNTNIYIFARNWLSFEQPAKMKLYYAKMYKDNELVRNYIPVEDNDGKLGLYDTISDKIFYNIGTGDFIAGPSEGPIIKYDFLEYLESTGTQYIDTGVNLTGDIDLEIEYRNPTYTQYERVFGLDPAAGNYKYQIEYAGTTNFVVCVNDTRQSITCDARTNFVKVKLLSNGEFYVDDTLKYNFNKTYTNSNYTIWLFKGYDQYSSLQIKSCKIWKQNELIKDLVPIRNNNNGEVGVYDKISHEILYNFGTGSFIAGPLRPKLISQLTAIYEDKLANLLPENIRKDITILGVTGTVEEGTIDTSDATATENDILEGKTAYAKDSKLIGIIKNNETLEIIPNNERQVIESVYTSNKGTIKAVDITTLEDYNKCLILTNAILTLQSPYIPIEYIEDRADAYIDTNLIINNNEFKIELDYEPTKVGYDYNGVWGLSSGTTEYEAWIATTGEYSRYNRIKPSKLSISANKRIKFTDEFVNGKFNTYIDNDLMRNYNVSVGNMNTSLVILRCSSSNANAKLYSTKIWKDSILVRDFTPMKNVLTGKVGLYDKVSKEFFTSMTDSEFIAGPEVKEV